MVIVDLLFVKKIIKTRLSHSNKWSHGRALIFAGSKGKIGAAIISTKACLRAGAGMVTVNIPKKERTAIFSSIPEAMVAFREEKTEWDKYTVYTIGPGLGIDIAAEKKVELLINNAEVPCVFDADALTIFSNKQQWLDRLPEQSILTPHCIEFDRLFGIHTSDELRRQTAIEQAKKRRIIIVLKGHQTFITNGKESFQNSTGNSGLAKGGSGDALTGIITAFLAQGYEPLQAANLGVYLHGLAADITLEIQSEESMLISDVIENLGAAFQQIQK
jgi:hydroxyethylthiazole kinase-like uncharacterized protein yjeF